MFNTIRDTTLEQPSLEVAPTTTLTTLFVLWSWTFFVIANFRWTHPHLVANFQYGIFS